MSSNTELRPTNSIGLDKVKLHVSDFVVDDVGRSGLELVPSTVNLETGETKDSILFRDKSGRTVSGSRAVRNTDRYNLTVNGFGLSLSFNPSKPWHPFNLVDDDDVFRSRFSELVGELSGLGIRADWFRSKVTRLDVSRNVVLNGSVRSYGSVWPWLKLKRSKHVRQYPDGYGSGNNSFGVILYDKGQESRLTNDNGRGIYSGNNLLRCEFQYKRNRSVISNIGCRTLEHVQQLGLPAIADVYREQVRTKLLSVVDGMNQRTIDFGTEVDILKQLKEQHDRTAITRHLALLSVPTFLEHYGTVDQYVDVLRSAGFSRQAINRNVRVLTERLLLYDKVYKSQQNTVGKMINELHTKLAA